MAELKVGLEIHGYIDVEQKLFCNCSIDHDAEPNTTICPICTGQPGAKPMKTNKHALDKALAIALLLNCKVNGRLLFQRKHYSWPDMPTGYQRTMSGSYASPVGEDGEFCGIRIRECHLEEDPARWDPETGKVDYNRAGYPLIEIVTEPDFTSVEQVEDWLKGLVTALSYVQAVHKKAGIKSDVNVSIGPEFERVEIKNVNSFSNIVAAITFEADRQAKEKAAGKNIPQQTRTYSDATGETLFMRSKEDAADYMFIPEPDVPAIIVDTKELEDVKSSIPELPAVKLEKLVAWGVPRKDAEVLVEEYVLIYLFEQVVAEGIDPVLAARWIRREVVRVANYNNVELEDVQLEAKHLVQLLTLIKEGKITDNVGQKIIEQLMEEPFDVNAYVADEGLETQGDAGALEEMCKQVISEQPKAVEDYKAGGANALNFLVGQVMRKTKGAAKPDVLIEIFKKLLE